MRFWYQFRIFLKEIMLTLINKFDYESLTRSSTNGVRRYNTPSGKLPSVTTILSKTKPTADRKGLDDWRKQVGVKAAQQITTEAANVGTLMHELLEYWAKNEEHEIGNNLIHRQAKQMANVVKENSEPHIDEVWGTEVGLYYPDLYAGTTDLVGMWKGKPAIMDFKQTNKPKKLEWISDYFLQGAAYAMAHDAMFGTDINNITILMCSRDYQMQIFEVDTKEEMDMWKERWALRVDQFYNM